MVSLVVAGVELPCTLRRSTRARRARIVVRPGGIEVVAPSWVPLADLQSFVDDNSAWIRRKEAALRSALAAHPGPARLADGGRVLLRGSPVELKVGEGQGRRAGLTWADGFSVTLPRGLEPERREPAVRALLESWLRRAAHADVEALVARYGPPHDLVPSAIRIKAQRRLWGSCTARGVINLNWRLILAPPAVLEYVVVHELCHLRERHHQPRFWRLVARVLPDYGGPRRWLRDNGHRLRLHPGDPA